MVSKLNKLSTNASSPTCAITGGVGNAFCAVVVSSTLGFVAITGVIGGIGGKIPPVRASTEKGAVAVISGVIGGIGALPVDNKSSKFSTNAGGCAIDCLTFVSAIPSTSSTSSTSSSSSTT